MHDNPSTKALKKIHTSQQTSTRLYSRAERATPCPTVHARGLLSTARNSWSSVLLSARAPLTSGTTACESASGHQEKQSCCGNLAHHCPPLPLHQRAVTGLQAEEDWKPVLRFTVSASPRDEEASYRRLQSHSRCPGKGRSCSITEESEEKLSITVTPTGNSDFSQRTGRYYDLPCSATAYLQALLLPFFPPTFPCRNFQALQQPPAEILPLPTVGGKSAIGSDGIVIPPCFGRDLGLSECCRTWSRRS